MVQNSKQHRKRGFLYSFIVIKCESIDHTTKAS